MLLSCVVLVFIATLNSSDGAVNSEIKKGPSTNFKCGQSNLSANIPGEVKGQKTSVGNFPWVAITFHKDSKSGNWKNTCAGTLISPRAVLTVAHCLRCEHCNPRNVTPENIMVGLGQLSREWNSTEPTAQKIAVKEVHVHPEFRGVSDMYANDIALLLLEHNVETNTAVMPACVDFLNGHTTGISEKTKGYVSFWDHLSDCSECESENNDMKFIQATIIDSKTCYNTVKSIQPSVSITPDKHCSEVKVPKGNSGVGLTVDFDGSHYLYGIASNLLQLKENHYTLFSNVSYHQEWIKENLK